MFDKLSLKSALFDTFWERPWDDPITNTNSLTPEFAISFISCAKSSDESIFPPISIVITNVDGFMLDKIFSASKSNVFVIRLSSLTSIGWISLTSIEQ